MRTLPILQPGQSVWLPREESQGTVIRPAETQRSYIICTDEGLLRRNRTHMRVIHQTQYHREKIDTQTHPVRAKDRSRDIDRGRGPYVTNSGQVSRPPERLDLCKKKKKKCYVLRKKNLQKFVCVGSG